MGKQRGGRESQEGKRREAGEEEEPLPRPSPAGPPGGRVRRGALVWCGVAGVCLMFLTSGVGVLVSPFWPEDWITVRSIAAADGADDARLWHVRTFVQVGWSDVMASRSPTEVDMASWKEHTWRLPRGLVSRWVSPGEPLPVVRAEGGGVVAGVFDRVAVEGVARE